jgi:hypothetical protein
MTRAVIIGTSIEAMAREPINRSHEGKRRRGTRIIRVCDSCDADRPRQRANRRCYRAAETEYKAPVELEPQRITGGCPEPC